LFVLKLHRAECAFLPEDRAGTPRWQRLPERSLSLQYRHHSAQSVAKFRQTAQQNQVDQARKIHFILN